MCVNWSQTPEDMFCQDVTHDIVDTSIVSPAVTFVSDFAL